MTKLEYLSGIELHSSVVLFFLSLHFIKVVDASIFIHFMCLMPLLYLVVEPNVFSLSKHHIEFY